MTRTDSPMTTFLMETRTRLWNNPSPLAAMRGLLMDLGFSGLIEKIEERFGKLVTNLLLVCLVFMVFVWALETLASIFVDGASLWKDGGTSALLGFGKLVLVFVALTIIFSAVCYSIFKRIEVRTIRNVEVYAEEYAKDRADEITTLGETEANRLREFGVEEAARIQQLMDKRLEEHRAKINALKTGEHE